MSWFLRKSKTRTPKQAEPPAPQDESITLALKCMKCESRFEVTLYRNVIRTAPGLCPCCQQVVEWMVLPQQFDYLEFLRIETEASESLRVCDTRLDKGPSDSGFQDRAFNAN